MGYGMGGHARRTIGLRYPDCVVQLNQRHMELNTHGRYCTW